MIQGVDTPDPRWAQVDGYAAAHLLPGDPALADALAANAAAGLPAIDVSPLQGRMLHLLARMAGARRVLEVGTLGGYSTIELARTVGEGGELVSLELDSGHAAVARANLDRAGLADRVRVIAGDAAETLAALEGPFDFVFIDADKQGNVTYLRHALRLSRPGTTIVVDNVVREGGVLDPQSDDPRIVGTRALYEAVAAEPRLSATVVQTVGEKGWDGFLLAVVEEDAAG
ncbi:O-methyltransferase [Sphingomonas corticis]|jgi:predicted O-methyltransferase YrrM|uniref:O-methyltransferase n=1 Tax=Sphingomonas corticis TaxID=2722791 RepID=A0ABX1CJA7_9SPHN|nr:O-methyltransferase [Sphingomonas corticis]NJR77454.1 O-methyltransferase [Sphingomonas corticis]